MQPAARDLAFYQGDDYAHEITFTDDATPPAALDLSAYRFAAQFRRWHADPDAVDFAVDVTQADTGLIILSLTAAQTAGLPSKGVWDLEVTLPSGAIETWLAGAVAVGRDVTREDA